MQILSLVQIGMGECKGAGSQSDTHQPYISPPPPRFISTPRKTYSPAAHSAHSHIVISVLYIIYP